MMQRQEVPDLTAGGRVEVHSLLMILYRSGRRLIPEAYHAARPDPASPGKRALNSAVECHLHTVEVAGSNPAAPTIQVHIVGIQTQIPST
jgi:hypothetical protein